MLHLALQVITVLLLTATGLSLVGRSRLLDLLTPFRLQYLLLALVAGAASVFLHSWVAAALALAASLVNAICILPYYLPLRPVSSGASAKLKLMLSNVLFVNGRHEKLLQLVAAEQPDVLVLQEFTEAWQTATVSLAESYPYSRLQPQRGGAGIALFSRFPLSETETLQFDATPRAGILTQINVEGTSVALLTLHPTTPMTGEKFARRNSQLRQAGQKLAAITGPKILLGDLNTVTWSPYLNDLLRAADLRDARRGVGLLTSWPYPLPSFLRIPIDHCLVSKEIVVNEIRIGRAIRSDHLPLLISVSKLDEP